MLLHLSHQCQDIVRRVFDGVPIPSWVAILQAQTYHFDSFKAIAPLDTHTILDIFEYPVTKNRQQGQENDVADVVTTSDNGFLHGFHSRVLLLL